MFTYVSFKGSETLIPYVKGVTLGALTTWSTFHPAWIAELRTNSLLGSSKNSGTVSTQEHFVSSSWVALLAIPKNNMIIIWSIFFSINKYNNELYHTTH